MGPMVDAAVRFMEQGGERAIVAELDAALDALRGVSGTEIVPT